MTDTPAIHLDPPPSTRRRVKSFRSVDAASPATRAAAADWLRTSLAFWLENAWDSENGGFVEALRLDGVPDRNAVRRTRVQARQIFTFAHAAIDGLATRERALALVETGLDLFHTRLRHADGGWIHAAEPNGNPADPARDLYDHAFIALAGAAAFEATGAARARALMEEALEVIDERFADRANAGYVENLDRTAPYRRSNPHMHLLEASLEAHRATGEPAHLDRARAIVELFEEAFFDPRTGALGEQFTPDWTLAGRSGEVRVEPGHCYEWATLLAAFEAADGRDLISWRRRLIGFADRHGRDSRTGFALNAITTGGTPIDAARRLWPQLEMLRARLSHPGTGTRGAPDRLFGAILAHYLSRGPRGGWIDEFAADGTPASRAVPASMPYHLMTALGPLARAALAPERAQTPVS